MLTSYIPIDRRHALADGHSLPEQTNGVALFADISGFTPLTVALVQELGPQRGAEEVLRHINPVYEALITELHRYRGAVIVFAGDSITCWFDDITDAAPRALTCALAMQRAVAQFATISTTAGTPLTIAVKIALAAGKARRFAVGDPTIQLIDTLVGSVLDEVASTEQLAERGEVMATAEVVDLVGETAVFVTEWRYNEQEALRAAVVTNFTTAVTPNPWPILSHDAILPETAKSWLLPPIYDRLQHGGHFLAELRPTVPLFLKFTGFDYAHDADVGQKLDTYIRWAQTVIAGYDGQLLQLIIGDKGSYWYAGFGAPVAHDDDTMRATAAALDLQQPPPELSFITQTRIGISWGRMWCGACGASARRTYAMMGAETNMAARLMGKADAGQILVSQRLGDVIGQNYALHYLGTISVKGYKGQVEVLEVLGRKLATAVPIAGQYETPLVERDGELVRLAKTLHGAMAGTGQIVRLSGETGVGKSHLTAVFAQFAHEQNYRVNMGYCSGVNQNIAYAPWRPIVANLLDVTLESGDMNIGHLVKQLEQALRQINPAWLVRIPLLGDLFGLPIPDNPATAVLDARLRQESLFALIAALCQRLSEQQPLLLIFEDVHWIDNASLALLNAIGRSLAEHPILLYVTHRPLPADDTQVLPSLNKLPPHEQLMLRELSEDGVVEMVNWQLSGAVSRLIPVLIAAKTGGNPFFVEEMVDTLRESGGIVQETDGSWVLSPVILGALQRAGCLAQEDGEQTLVNDAPLTAVDLGIPDSVQGIVLSRIDHLYEEHKLFLKIASVIGQRFGLNLTRLTHADTALALETIMQWAQLLTEHDFIYNEHNGDSDFLYAFRHNITQEVAYATLLFAQRRQLHRAVCTLLEQFQPNNIPALAYHAFWGEDWERALAYDLQAGRQARKVFANKEAVTHFQRAQHAAGQLPLEDSRKERLEIVILLGEIFVQLGRYDEASTELEAGLSLAEEMNDDNSYIEVCRWMARRWELSGQFDTAWLWIEKGLRKREVGKEETAVAEILITAGLISSRRGEADAAQQSANEALAIGDRLQDDNLQGRAYNLFGHLARLRGAHEVALRQFQKGIALYEKAGNLHGTAMAHNQMANAYFALGQWTGANDHYQLAQSMFDQIGDVYNRAFTENNLGQLALYRDDFELALALYQSALSVFQQGGKSLYVQGVVEMNIGATFVKLRNLEQSEQHLQTAVSHFSQAGVRDFLPELHRHRALMRLEGGELPAALQEAETAVSLARDAGMNGEEGIALRVIGQIQQAQGELDAARTTLEASLAILDKTDDRYEIAQTRTALTTLRAVGSDA